MPRTFVAIAVNLQAVLDLRDGRVRQRLQVSLDRILTVDWRKEVRAGREPITQSIGRAASQVGLEGLIVPSAVEPKGHNLLVIPANLQSSSKLAVLNPDSLPG
jgi:RES domain-containing protein